MTGRIPILDAEPVIGCGRYLARAVVGERFEVAATVLREGHDAVAASVSFRDPAGRVRQWERMRKREPWSDRWFAELSADDEGGGRSRSRAGRIPSAPGGMPRK